MEFLASPTPSGLPITRRLTKQEINDFPLQRWAGPVHLVQSEEELARTLPLLSGASLLGFDTETRPAFKKGQKHLPALLQLATESDVVLIRLGKLGLPETIRDILSSQTIIKTGVAISDDLQGLQQIAPFSPNGFVDLAKISKTCGIMHHGLRGMAAAVLGVRISKTARISNWAKNELSSSQISYAATDAWIGREIHQYLIRYQDNLSQSQRQ